MRSCPPRRSRASRTSGSSATRSCSTTRWPAIEKDAEPGGGLPTDRRQRAPPRRHLGAQARGARRRRAAAPTRPRFRVAVIVLLARLFGTRAVSDLVTALEGDEEDIYESQSSPEVADIAADEREHAEIWRQLKTGDKTTQPERGHRRPRALAPVGPVRDAPGDDLRGQRRARQQPRARHGRRRRGRRRGPLHPARRDRRPPRRRVQHGGRRVHLDAVAARAVRAPDRPRARRARGHARGGAGRAGGPLPGEGLPAGRRPTRSPPGSSRTRNGRSTRWSARSSGSIPTQLGSPVGAAAGSFVAFAVGAAVPVLPYSSRADPGAFTASLVLSLAALFAVGAGVSLLTGRGMLFSGLRQVVDRRGGRGRDVRRRVAHRRRGHLRWPISASGFAPPGSSPAAWSNGPNDRYAAHDHGYDKVIVVDSGSIRFGLPDRGESVDLAVGDRLDLPAGHAHDAVVGPDGVTCLEAHLPAGTLAASRPPRRRGPGERAGNRQGPGVTGASWVRLSRRSD